MEMNWSAWFRCESSFGLLLVPRQPGIFALAEEVIEPTGPTARRMLAVFEIDATDDLVRALSRLFTPVSPFKERMATARCYARYAVMSDAVERQRTVVALKDWLNSQRGSAAQIFEQARPRPGYQEGDAEEDEDLHVKTVAERAVDRVTKGIELTRMFR